MSQGELRGLIGELCNSRKEDENIMITMKVSVMVLKVLGNIY